MTIREAIKKYSKDLKEVTHIPQKEVEILIQYLLEKNSIWLYLNYDKELKNEAKLKQLIKKRATDYPIEYIINKVSFYGEVFFIKEGVLIPRPETELLVDKAMEIINQIEKPKILEIGVGSGIISIMLATMCKNISIVSVDINKDALLLCAENIKKHNVENIIDLRYSNLLENVPEKEFDIIISNPPYIANDYSLPKNVMYEPKNALFGGNRGDELIKEIILKSSYNRTKYLLCEIGYDQKKSLEEYFLKFNIKEYSFYKDYENFNRGFILEFKREEKNV